jgi:hypothetical protein
MAYSGINCGPRPGAVARAGIQHPNYVWAQLIQNG